MFFADALNPGNRQEALDERIGIALAQSDLFGGVFRYFR
jgi:hypothetical protein